MILQNRTLTLLLAALAALAAAGCPPPAATPKPQTGPFTLQLAIPTSTVSVNAPLPVELTYTNVSAAPERILNLRIMEGYPLYFDIIDTAGKRVRFVGPEISPKVGNKDYVSVQPGAEFKQKVDLKANGVGGPGYALTAPGNYTVEAIYEGHYGIPELRSNTVQLTVQ